MRKISSRSNVIKKAQALTPTSAADIVYAIAGGDKSGAMTGALSDLVKKNPTEFSKAFSTLNAAEKSVVTDRMSALGFRPAGTTMPISYRPGTSTLTRAAPTVSAPPVSGPTTLPSGTSPVIPPTNTPTTMPPGTPTVRPPIRPTTMPPGTPPVRPPIGPTTMPPGTPPVRPPIGQGAAGAGRAGAALRGAGSALRGAGSAALRGGGALLSGAGGAASTAVGAVGTALGVGTGTAAAVVVGIPLILATPFLMEKWFGSRDALVGETELEKQFVSKAEELFEPIWDHDVTVTFNPWASTSWSDEKSGDLGEISGPEKNNIIMIILGAALSGNVKEVSSEAILEQLRGTGRASLEDMKNDEDLMADINAASSYFTALAKDMADAIRIAQRNAPKDSGQVAGPVAQTGGGGSIPTGTRGEALDYVGASKIMIENGFLDSVQTDWTPEFDAGFRGFIDSATRGADNIPDSNLSSGQTWGEAADDLGFSPDARGAIVAVKRLAKFIGKAPTPSAIPDSSPAEPKPKGEAPVVSGKENILAQMVGILYNERLVEGGGFLSYEKKQTQSLVDALGGAGPSGFPNTAKKLMERNPQLASVIPDELNMPVTKKTIKGTQLLPAFKMVQETIHDIYEAANPGMINPGKNKATENVKKYFGITAGFYENRFVKSAQENEIERASKIMMEKGYLNSIQSRWTPAFDAAFREFIDASTMYQNEKTKLMSGTPWQKEYEKFYGDATPNQAGAVKMVVDFGKYAPFKSSGMGMGGSSKGIGGSKNKGFGTSKVPSSDGEIEKASRIMMEKGYLDSIQTSWTPTFDAAFREFVDASTMRLKEKTNLMSGVPWQKEYEKFFGDATPNQSGAVKMVVDFGKFAPYKKEAAFNSDRFVKLAEERRERIRREIEANLTPAEKAAMRRLRMRGA
jgi:hypothetical protein